MQITRFDKEKVRLLRDALNKVLEKAASDFGVKIKVANASFDDASVTYKLEVGTIVNGTVQTKEVRNFIQYAQYNGLKAEDLGAEFTFHGVRYQIAGLNTNRKNSLLAKSTKNGKLYWLPLEAARALMNKGFTKPKDGGCFLDKVPATTRAEAIKKAEEMQRDNPEMYYADGELQANGMSNAQIREHWIQRFMRETIAA